MAIRHLCYEQLTARQFEVLRSIIHLYVETARPVSSRQLSKQMNRRLSPATLRNAMADLEEMGFLYQPHTSAGRQPTDLAYRIYVDRLVMGSDVLLTPNQRQIFLSRISNEVPPEILLEQTSSVLSAETGCTAVFTLPDIGRTVFKHIEFVHLHGCRVLAIFVSEFGLVHQKVVQTRVELSQGKLRKISRLLNNELGSLPLSAIKELLLTRMREDKDLYDKMLKDAFDLARQAFGSDAAADDLHIGSTAKMLGQPEFADIDRMRQIYGAFEQKSHLLEILNSCVENDSIEVLIGSELDLPEFRDFTLVSASYKYDGRNVGTVGVVGPMRMNYPKIAAWVGFAGQMLTRFISREDLSAEGESSMT